MTKKKADTFANVACVGVQESAANTATYTKFAFPFSIMDKMALVIQRMEYLFGSFDQFNSTLDFCTMALTAGSPLVSIDDQRDALLVDNVRWTRIDTGAAANGHLMEMPYVKDFTNLSGGGLLVAPNPLYGAIKGSGCAAVCSGYIKLFYTYMELDTDEYWQLVESRRVIGA